jgi:hypothetical protein
MRDSMMKSQAGKPSEWGVVFSQTRQIASFVGGFLNLEESFAGKGCSDVTKRTFFPDLESKSSCGSRSKRPSGIGVDL